MNKYSIITYATVTTEYIVEAENEEEAEDKYVNGEHLDTNDLDYHDEQIESIVKIEEKTNGKE